MSSAQERAFARLACRRGLLEAAAAEAAIARAETAGSALPQALVGDGAISPKAASELLRELANMSWACGRCGRVLPWSQLASLPTLACAQRGCAGEIVPVGEARAGLETVREPRSGKTHTNPERTELISLHRPSGSRRAAPDPTPPRRQIGPYALVRELGRGSNGVVYLAERDARPYALKLLKDSDLADEETVARFQLEAAVAKKIDHPGVIAVHEVGRDGDRLYSVMDYCPGPTLKQQVRAEERFEPRRAAELVREIALMLEATHQAGVIHRDVKPSNIILEEGSGRPRLTDFGLARDHSLLRSMTQTGDILGTPYYMAPEQFRGDRELDHRIDLFALGVILFECLTGQRPHDAATPMLLAERVMHSEPRSPKELVPEIPDDLAAICTCAMARDPEERYPTARSMAGDLERFLSGERPQAQRRPAPPLVPALIGVVVVLVSALGLALAWRGLPEQTDPVEAARLGEARGQLAELTREVDALGAASTPGRRSALVERLRALERLSHGDDELVRQVVGQRRRVEALDDLARAEALARERRPFDALRPIFVRARAAAEGHPRELALIERVRVESLIRRGRSGEALQLLGQLGDTPRLNLLRGRALELARRERLAREAYAKAGEAEGPAGLRGRAALARLEGDHAAAEAAASRAVDAGEREALVDQGLALLAEGKAERAELVLDRAREALPDDPRVLHALGVLGLREQKHGVALLHFERAEALFEEDLGLETLLMRGLCQLQMGRLNGAKGALDAVLQAAPEHVEALVHRGVLALRRKEPEQVERCWKRAAALDGDRALAAVERWHKQVTVRAYRRVVGLKVAPPKDRPDPRPQPTDERPQTLADAIRQFQKMWQANTRVRLGLPRLGSVPRSVGERIDGRVSGLSAEQATVLRSALKRAARGRPWEEVSSKLEEAHRIDPTQALVARERLRLLIAADDVEGARRALQKARAAKLLTPAQVGWCEGEIAWRAGDRPGALKAYGACAAQDAEGALGRVARARISFLSGRFREAGQYAWKATRLASDSAAAWLSVALVSVAVGELSSAQQALNEAFGIVGARDSVLLATRAAFIASVEAYRELSPGQEGAADQLRLTLGPFARLLAARLVLSSPLEKAHTWAGKLLSRQQAACAKRADWFGLQGRYLVESGASAERALEAWRRAKALQPGWKPARDDRFAFRARFKQDPVKALGD